MGGRIKPTPRRGKRIDRGNPKSVYTRDSFGGEIAQLVEQRTENPCVGGSIPPLATSLRSERSGERRMSRRSQSSLGETAKADPRSEPTAWQASSMYHYVYILVSDKDASIHYTGLTQDLQARLVKHNQGGCPHTAKDRPWRLETAIAFASREKAAAFEQYLKSGSGREFARRHF